MDYLWSPRRLEYVTGTATTSGCVFCDAQTSGQASLIVFRGSTCFVILNKFPYNSGHLVVVPNRHIPSLAAATTDELCELIELARRSNPGRTPASFEFRALAPVYAGAAFSVHARQEGDGGIATWIADGKGGLAQQGRATFQ